MTSPDFQHFYANLKDVCLHYVTLGQGRPVVFLHGWPQTWYEWRLVMPLLADKFFCVAPDLQGLGDSSRPVRGYDKKTVAEGGSVADCGHFIPEEKPHELTDQLRTFLSKTPQG